MRLTINLDDDLYAMARAHSIATRTSISKAVCDLLKRRRGPSGPEGSESQFFDEELGLLVSRSQRESLVGMDEIREALDDELVRPMEIAGLSPEEIKLRLKS